jgi:hypothetical protein
VDVAPLVDFGYVTIGPRSAYLEAFANSVSRFLCLEELTGIG